MMRKYLVFFVVTTVALLGLSAYLVFGKGAATESSQLQTVFMDSYLVFEEFEMKKDYDKRLAAEIGPEQTVLDALGSQLNATTDPLELAKLKKDFTVEKLAFDEKFNALSQQYTNEVYKRLNEYIKAFGKAGRYGVVLGSNGQGNVMYVDIKQDITKELILYINKEYSH